MATTRNTPKRHKGCVFCKYWVGDAKLKFINSTVGYEYESTTVGKCAKKNVSARAYQACTDFEPNADASRLL